MFGWEYIVLLLFAIAIYSSLWKPLKTKKQIISFLRRFWERRIIHVWAFLILAVIFIVLAVFCIVYYYLLNYLPSFVFTIIAPIAYFFLLYELRKLYLYRSPGGKPIDESILRKEVGKGGLVAGIVIAQFFLSFLFSLSLYGIIVLMHELLKNRTFSKIVIRAKKIELNKYSEEIQAKADKLINERIINYELNSDNSMDSYVNYDDFEPYVAEIEELCAICHNPIKAGKSHKCKSCAMPFHKNCLLTWIQNREVGERFCPVCHGNLGYI